MTTEQSSINVFEDIPCLRPYAAKINEHLGGRRSGEGVLFVRERFKAFRSLGTTSRASGRV